MMRAHLQRLAERRRRSRLPRGHVRAARPAPEPAPAKPEQREREAAGGEDVAAYTCTCGFHWEAPVSTTIACPHCGAGQAW